MRAARAGQGAAVEHPRSDDEATGRAGATDDPPHAETVGDPTALEHQRAIDDVRRDGDQPEAVEGIPGGEAI